MAVQVGASGRSNPLCKSFGEPLSRRFLDRADGMLGLPPVGRLVSFTGGRIGLVGAQFRRPLRACDYGYRRNAFHSSYGLSSLGVRQPAFMAAVIGDRARIRPGLAREIFGADPPADNFLHPNGMYCQR